MNNIIIQWENKQGAYIQNSYTYTGTDIDAALSDWKQTIQKQYPGATIIVLYPSFEHERLFPTKTSTSLALPALPGETMIPESLQKVLQRIENNFTYHRPKEEQQIRYIDIRDKAKELAIVLAYNCPESRELSLALTQLEVVVMWANASIARNE